MVRNLSDFRYCYGLATTGLRKKGNRLEAYRFIDQYHREFGIRWLLRRLEIYPNAYYNYRKNRKAGYCAKKSEVHRQIAEIYHSHNGVDGYRSMTVYLERREYHYSCATIHKYMNREPGLRSIVRPKKPGTKQGKHHRVFENLLKQDFQADRPNQNGARTLRTGSWRTEM